MNGPLFGIVALVVAGAVISWWLTGVVRRYAVARAILDMPGDRSSHTVPTPRGGGLALAVVTLGGIIVAALAGWIDATTAIALVPAGAAVAVAGWRDDREPVRASIRITVHFAAATWVVLWIGGMPSIGVGAGRVVLGDWGILLAIIGVVWCINFYNFMDGIDGIAGGEAASVGLIAGGLLWSGGHVGLASIAFVIAAAAIGFLPWNWAPARIFMGDVGSGLLGLLFGAFAVAAENAGALPVLVTAMLLGVFIVDATVTLVRRALHGERWYYAHRDHAYQRAARYIGGHAPISATVIGLNAILGALAWYAMARPASLPVVLAIAAILLVAVYVLVEQRAPFRINRHPHAERSESTVTTGL